ncbi:hypothetical protein D3C84_1135760 [compost metagenome]
MVGLGQIEHVVDQLCHPLQLFKVAVQGLAVFVQVAWAGEGDLGVRQQVRQWRAQFVGDIGRERRQTLKGIIQTFQHGVDGLCQFGQFNRHLVFRQARGQRARRYL